MSVLLAGGVAFAYMAGVVGLHRLNVRRQRSAAGGFPPLRWLDWDTLLEGLLPEAAEGSGFRLPWERRVLGGGPAPRVLSAATPEEARSRRAVLCALVEGADVGEEAFTAAGFSGGQVRWLKTLSHLKADPERALARLESGDLGTAAEVYLREHLRLGLRTHAVNLELAVFSAKRRLTQGLARYGEHPALFFVRAQASALLGFNRAAIDDLARAVYFSRQAPFYLRAVMETPYIAEVRPALVQQCRLALDPGANLG